MCRLRFGEQSERFAGNRPFHEHVERLRQRADEARAAAEKEEEERRAAEEAAEQGAAGGGPAVPDGMWSCPVCTLQVWAFVPLLPLLVHAAR